MPARMVRCSVLRSTCSLIGFFDFGTASAAITFAVRSSTFMNVSMEIRSLAVRVPGWCWGSGSRFRFRVPGSEPALVSVDRPFAKFLDSFLDSWK